MRGSRDSARPTDRSEDHAKFDVLTAVAAPLLRANVDTDAIIPSREMKTVSKTGLADGLFAGWRYTRHRRPRAEPAISCSTSPPMPARKSCSRGENFGCGSSREHAVWALEEYGIRAVIAPSFAPIFHGNCVRNGILPVRLRRRDDRAARRGRGADPQRRIA